MDKKVTIYTLAKELNMSVSMVSRAFNPNARIDSDKRALVLDTAKKYNFSPNSFASRLSGKEIKIGVLIYCRFSPIAEKMVEGIKAAYNECKNYKISYEIKVVSSKDKKSHECEEELMAFKDFDGVIISGFGAARCKPMLERFLEHNKNLVQMQSVNYDINSLFNSRHDEKLASNMAAEFLYNCLRRGRKNVLLFTGNTDNFLHRSAKNAFIIASRDYSLNLLECIDMHDDEKYLEDNLKYIFNRYKDRVDGIYITSGNSVPLCRYIHENKLDVSLVTFDTHKELNYYIKNGTVAATISQNVRGQAKSAMLLLCDRIVKKRAVPSTVFSQIRLVMKSNLN